MQLSLSASVLPAAQRARGSASSARLAAPRARRSHTRSVRVCAGKVEQLSAEQLEIAIAERDKPLVIDFYARCVGRGASAAAVRGAWAAACGEPDGCVQGGVLRSSLKLAAPRAQLVWPLRADGC